MSEYVRFYHPRFLDGDPIDDRERQVLALVTEILADEPYFLSLVRRERVPYTIPEELSPPLASEFENIQSVSKDPSSIRFIQNPSPEVQMVAINIDRSVLKFIKNPCFEALMKVNGIGESP